MTRILLDRETIDRIGNLEVAAEIFDEKGNLLGFFEPLGDRDFLRNLQPPISAEESERRKQVRHGRSLQEILADLERRQ